MIMALRFRSTSSPHKLFNMSWLHSFPLLLLFTILTSTLVSSSSSSPISYADHCNSVVPESTPTVPDFTDFALPQTQSGYYNGGHGLLNQQNSSYHYSLSLHTPTVHKTKAEGVFKIQGTLTLCGQFEVMDSSSSSRWGGSLSFSLQGFWSESLKRLCMVGSAQIKSKEGNSLPDLETILKLKIPHNFNISTSMVTGSLESLKNSADEPSSFDPISILMFPQANYEYTLGFKNFKSGDYAPPTGPSLGLRNGEGSLCSMFSREMNGRLEYSSDCNSTRKCNPFLEDATDSLPSAMSLHSFQCSEEQKRLRLIVEFPRGFDYYRPFNPNTTLVGEGSWDSEKNQLRVVACRILNSASSSANARVGDCSYRLSLRLPAILSLRATSSVVGQIWTNKTANELGYFKAIAYRSIDGQMPSLSGSKYDYGEMERVNKSCPATEGPLRNGGMQYPKADSYDMRFQPTVKNSRGRIIAWGNAFPLSVGDQLYTGYFNSFTDSVSNDNNSSPVNMSYQMSFTLFSHPKSGSEPPFFNSSFSLNNRVEISAEGVYDPNTGGLCMVGCRNLDLNTQISRNTSEDCEILVNIHFPPLNAKDGRIVEAKIESTRKESDPLHFDHLDVSGTAFYAGAAEWSIWRMDMEIAMALISETVVCVFIGVQIFHAKKHPNVPPSTSLLMLVILTLGHMVPLLLNFEAMFFGRKRQRGFWFRSHGWLEFDEVGVRVVSMVASIMQFRLLQLSWFDCLRPENQKDLWSAEKKTWFLCVSLYFAGAVAALLKHATGGEQRHSAFGDLKSYAGLVLDGFLLPQILLNVFKDPTEKEEEKTLSRTFYVGTTLARLVPHAYDLYRAHKYSGWNGENGFGGEYIYASPGADFYSPVWDVIIPCGCLLFALTIYLQQRYGGRCILPRRFRVPKAYEKVPSSLSVVAADKA